MRDPNGIYSVDDDVARDLTEHVRSGGGPVLLHLVRGFVDAGSAGQLAADHLTANFDVTRLATFDVDQLLDYRSRRPMMTFDASTWSDYAEPALVVDVVRDAEGVPFLLLHGVEPDIQWERYVAAVRQLVERFDVQLTVGVHGIPMGVPHTRPLSVTAHGTRAELVEDHVSWFGTVQVPASASAVLEYRLGRWGHDAMGFAVHVPHYLAQSPFPQASLIALEQVQRATGLALDAQALEAAARETLDEVERQVAGSEEVAAVVRALEEQYDSFTRAIGRTNLLAETSDIPTADELGAEFERFLAQQQGGDGPGL
ncbi:proteasome assembly chaperone family protein [Actinotalea sp. K2]|uniref:proteasome assembly chaperone family protein n=1 Tax=Actinotalea sp. K2 TaxID=2939438 RepID=UPI0020177F2F|nr:PAC2 family protein [Actinotalea sp. K2]MCL3860140.1 PAC2 family protein [Actinotalea sp. K2]